ncbi:PREDICTED: endogenous retrovirus group K member 25 Pol protein-like [Calidris pugnax]|uniref:endogenous retrovirus group K member 25 Pol protein-like n=1 Tax=Calidris pugnax TaxID=198806 RepID=UPI00071DFB28|nr:PREDICTED: endogenous retrovirus group K member 25 Pol protein-like [Calidris pugnax]
MAVVVPKKLFNRLNSPTNFIIRMPRHSPRISSSHCSRHEKLSLPVQTVSVSCRFLQTGSNPPGLQPHELQQTDVTHSSAFGVLHFVHVTVDTFSGFIVASAHRGEKAKDVCRHWLRAIAVLGIPQKIKTDNGPGYVTRQTKTFLAEWGILHVTGIPHSPTGQAIIERSHLTLKNMLYKQKRGNPLGITPQEQLDKATYVWNFLNLTHGDNLTANQWRYGLPDQTNMKPTVFDKDLQSGKWMGPVPLLSWGHGYGCVSLSTGPYWLPAKNIKPANTIQKDAESVEDVSQDKDKKEDSNLPQV